MEDTTEQAQETEATEVNAEAVEETTTTEAETDNEAKASPTPTTILGGAGKAETAGDSEGEEAGDGESRQAEYDLKIPEGVEVDQKALESFLGMAAEASMSQEHVQGFVDMHIDGIKAVAEYTEQLRLEEVEAWGQKSREAFGKNFDAAVKDAARAIDAFGGDELRALFEETGIGNHPVMLRAFEAIGKSIKEDSISGSTSGGGGPSEKEKIYRQMFDKSPELFDKTG